jgi:single-strand DNA-binding protein
MAKCVNKALLLGYVGKAPEIRSTAGGTLAASFSLATSERQQDRQGNWTDKTEWHNLIAFGRTAEIVRDYVGKGTHLFIQGKLQTRSWEDKESGQRRFRTEIVVFDLTLLNGNGGSNGLSTNANGQSQSGRSAREPGYSESEMDAQFGDETLDPAEIPF